jgi:hypothetical protein
MRTRRAGKQDVADSCDWATCFPGVEAATANGDSVA